jgi:hypothetical protein
MPCRSNSASKAARVYRSGWPDVFFANGNLVDERGSTPNLHPVIAHNRHNHRALRRYGRQHHDRGGHERRKALEEQRPSGHLRDQGPLALAVSAAERSFFLREPALGYRRYRGRYASVDGRPNVFTWRRGEPCGLLPANDGEWDRAWGATGTVAGTHLLGTSPPSDL